MLTDKRLAEIILGFTGLEYCAPADRLDAEETFALATELRKRRQGLPLGDERPTFEQVRDCAIAAVKALDDWTNVNETEFTGWGNGDVPAGATWWRIKSGQALKALEELRKKWAIE